MASSASWVVANSVVAEAQDWASVYRQHAGDVARWAARLGGPVADVEDLVHEVFLVVQARLPEFRGDAQIKTWLYRITVNVVRHHRRKNRLRRWVGGTPNQGTIDTPSDEADPEETAMTRQALMRVYEALEGLSETNRRVFILHELEGLTGPEIATLEGVRPETIWVRLHRAKKAFRNQLQSREDARL